MTTTWWAEVAFDAPIPALSDDHVDALMTPDGVTSARAIDDRLVIELEIATSRLADAAGQAVTAAEAAYETAFEAPAPADSVRVLSREVRDQEMQHPHVPSLVGIADITEMLGVSRQRAHQLTSRDDFPAAIDSIGTASVYLRSQVDAFARTWDRTTGRPRLR